MNEKNFANARIHTISGRVKLEGKLLKELKEHGIDHIDSTTIDIETGELFVEVHIIICGD